MQKEIDWLNKKLGQTCEELDQTHEHLVNSQEEYTAMKKELERVQDDLISTRVQLDKHSMLSTSHKLKKVLEKACAQRAELLDEVQAANKKNANLQKQLAGVMASMTADPMASYRPRGIGPKN